MTSATQNERAGCSTLAELADPRSGNAQRHLLDEIMMIALVALLCGAESCVDPGSGYAGPRAGMALFGRSKEPLLRRFLRLPGGVPSHDTFSRIFRLLDPDAFEACFARYLGALAEQVAGVVAIDGKTVRRSFEQGPCARKPRPPAPLRPQRAARRPGPGLHPRQNQTRRMGRRLPPQPSCHRLMRSPCRR